MKLSIGFKYREIIWRCLKKELSRCLRGRKLNIPQPVKLAVAPSFLASKLLASTFSFKERMRTEGIQTPEFPLFFQNMFNKRYHREAGGLINVLKAQQDTEVEMQETDDVFENALADDIVE